MTLEPSKPRAFYPQGGMRRKYARAGQGKPGEETLPPDPPSASPAHCPPAILDSSPDGSGLGVWVLVAETSEAGGTYCTYEYGGGIA